MVQIVATVDKMLPSRETPRMYVCMYVCMHVCVTLKECNYSNMLPVGAVLLPCTHQWLSRVISDYDAYQRFSVVFQCLPMVIDGYQRLLEVNHYIIVA